MIDLERLKQLQKSLNFLNIVHLNALSDGFDIPDDFRAAWHNFLEHKDKLNTVMKKYGFDDPL